MKKNDIILVIGILLLSSILATVFLFMKKDGKEVIITVDGKVYKEVSINEETNIRIETNEGYNELIIKSGEVYIKEADCLNNNCVKQGKVCHSGETIVCLPHKVIVTIK